MTVFMRLPFHMQSCFQHPIDERQQHGDQVCDFGKQQKDFDTSLQPSRFLILPPSSLPSFFGSWLCAWFL